MTSDRMAEELIKLCGHILKAKRINDYTSIIATVVNTLTHHVEKQLED